MNHPFITICIMVVSDGWFIFVHAGQWGSQKWSLIDCRLRRWLTQLFWQVWSLEAAGLRCFNACGHSSSVAEARQKVIPALLETWWLWEMVPLHWEVDRWEVRCRHCTVVWGACWLKPRFLRPLQKKETEAIGGAHHWTLLEFDSGTDLDGLAGCLRRGLSKNSATSGFHTGRSSLAFASTTSEGGGIIFLSTYIFTWWFLKDTGPPKWLVY